LSLVAGAVPLAVALVARERGALDPIMPLDLLRTRLKVRRAASPLHADTRINGLVTIDR
jgi:hypothetical protein